MVDAGMYLEGSAGVCSVHLLMTADLIDIVSYLMTDLIRELCIDRCVYCFLK